MASKVMNQSIFLAIICIAFVFASGEATNESSTLFCFTPDKGHCPDINACNQYCLTFPFRGGAVCRENNVCCCKS
ncbi:unnamed protein product [Sphenostylis stenocarpa]|uniref:Uncharacterized protein n=1 Tax=Sphenostylis stenocarpa TaxID=92480 RepID=A0AA86VY92_9FABA|nr:unnamed protein product [Sphenostylis stenocarpa]